jgi:isoquinoline 1-oxidoreductase beta subunit
MNAPVKLIYSREDDMTSGIYRPMYSRKVPRRFRCKEKSHRLHINAGGIPESPLDADSFPAGAVENYLAEDWTIPSNITTDHSVHHDLISLPPRSNVSLTN